MFILQSTYDVGPGYIARELQQDDVNVSVCICVCICNLLTPAEFETFELFISVGKAAKE